MGGGESNNPPDYGSQFRTNKLRLRLNDIEPTIKATESGRNAEAPNGGGGGAGIDAGRRLTLNDAAAIRRRRGRR